MKLVLYRREWIDDPATTIAKAVKVANADQKANDTNRLALADDCESAAQPVRNHAPTFAEDAHDLRKPGAAETNGFRRFRSFRRVYPQLYVVDLDDEAEHETQIALRDGL